MDHEGFDTLTRAMAARDTTRRAALRLVSGGVLGALAARLGLPENAVAKQKKRKRRTAPKKEGSLQAEGKRKGKKGKGKKPPQPKPRECYSDAACGACQRCVDGECRDLAALCDPDACQEEFCNPETNSWECRRTCQLESSVCCQGQCYASPACSGGKQLNPETCQCECPPGQWECLDGSCVPDTKCCQGEKECDGGVCVSADQCCPGQKRCLNETCIPEDQCCFDVPVPDCDGGCKSVVCVNGQEQCRPRELGALCKVRGGDNGTCCNGQCTKEALVCPIYPHRSFSETTCRCDCPNGGTDIPGSNNRLCCPAGFPFHDNIGKCWRSSVDWACAIGYHKCTPQDPPNDYGCCRD
jgi:hypothetical protein